MASCQPIGEADVIVETEATAMTTPLPVQRRLGRHVEDEPQPHAILVDAAVDDLHALLEHLDAGDPAQRAVRARDHRTRRLLEAHRRRADQLVHLRDPHGPSYAARAISRPASTSITTLPSSTSTSRWPTTSDITRNTCVS